MINASNLSKKIPLYKIGEDLIISKRADYTIGFKLCMTEIFNLDEDDYNEIHTLFDTLIKRMPDYSIVHKQDFFFKKKYNPQAVTKSNSLLGQYSELKFLEREHIEHDSYIFFTQSSAPIMNRMYVNNLLNRNAIPSEAIDINIYENFIQTVAAFEHTIKSSPYFSIERLHRKDYINEDNGHGLIMEYLTLNKKPISVDINFENGLRVGAKKCNYYTIENVEQLVRVDTCQKIDKLNTKLSFPFQLSLGLKFDHVYNQYIFCGIHKEELQIRDIRQKKLQSFSKLGSENKTNAQKLKKFNEQANDNTRIVQAHYNVLVFNENEHELKTNSQDTDVAMQKLGVVKSKFNIADAPELFWAGVPGNASDIPSALKMTMLSEQAVCLFNSETCTEDSKSTDFGMRLCDRLTGYPLYVDFVFEAHKKRLIDNRNMFIVGPSGSGKSFFTNSYVRHLLDCGHHVVIIDLGGSYKRLCELYNGIYLDFDLKNPLMHNPFILPKGVLEPSNDKVETLMNLVYALWLDDDDNPTKTKDSILREHIIKYYQILKNRPEIFPCFNSFFEYIRSVYEKLKETGDAQNEFQYFDYPSFFLVLRQYYKGGAFENLLNATTNIDLINTPLVVFELENIKDSATLLSIETLMIMEAFLNKVFLLGDDDNLLKSLIIEEAWKAVMNPKMARFMKYAVKTLRKHYGQFVTVTQELDDLLNNDFIKSTIVVNTDIKILLDQSKFKKGFKDVANLLGLSEREEALVLSLNKLSPDDPTRNFREVFMRIGTLSKVYAVELSDVEYATYTTNKDETAKIYQMANKKGLENALVQFAENKRYDQK